MWLTKDGHFVSAYHVLKAYVNTEQMWDYKHGKDFPVRAIIKDANENQYYVDNYLVIDVEKDIIIGKARIDKPLTLPALSFAGPSETVKDTPLMIWHENKLSEGKIEYVDENWMITNIEGPHGMSGSAIWAHGRLAGIVTHHNNEDHAQGPPVVNIYNLLSDYVRRHKERH